MSCKEKGRYLDSYADGELDVAGTLAFEEHLDSCAPCKEALRRLTSLSAAVRERAPLEPAPAHLRSRIRAHLAAPGRRPAPDWRWGLLLASPGIVALVFVAWMVLLPIGQRAVPTAVSEPRIVYHITSGTHAEIALRNLGNHLNASPHARIVVVAHNEGVDFLLRGARSESGQPLEPAIDGFARRGVQFRVCGNTLERREIGADQVIGAATLVPSGIAEIGRLQTEEGFAYMRL